jgi:hypothetical protein
VLLKIARGIAAKEMTIAVLAIAAAVAATAAVVKEKFLHYAQL